MKFKYILSLFFLFFIGNSYAQLSKKHYIPPLTSSDGFSEQLIYISTPKTINVSYTITPVGNTGDFRDYSGVVSNLSPKEINILDNSRREQNQFDSHIHIPVFSILDQPITDKGFIIEASDVIYVSVRVRSTDRTQANQSFHAGALVSKGNSALGTNFRIGGLVRGGNVVSGHVTFASFMATEDNTTVSFSDIPNNMILPSGVPLPTSITLDEGESYILPSHFFGNVAGSNDPKDIIGGLISSDKPIVVNSGSTHGSFGNGNGRDYGIDQIVGSDRIGSEYILVKGAGNNQWENVLVIGHEDNTEVFVNGSLSSSLNAGEYVVIEGDNFNTSENMYVRTTKPTFVYQGIGGQINGEPNQGMFFVPPLSCENKGDVNNIASINRIGSGNFDGGITIVTNAGATVNINGQNINTFSISGPSNVTGNTDYVTYKVNNLTGDVIVESDQELYCAYFNRNGFAASGSFYSGFPSAPEINFNTTVAALGNCLPNVTLEAANTDLFDEFEWQFFNESSSSWEQRSINPTYKPDVSEPGRYRLIGKIDCTNSEFISVEIPVSICPDDYDNDLIIDNLDVDLDKDGIVNCDESLGNANLDFSNTTNPSVIFADNSTDNSIANGNLNTTLNTSTLSGDNSGNFTASVAPDSGNSDLLYELSFSKDVNIKFTQSNSPTNSNSVFYILKIGPNSKNITLLDPDNQILVDTNFNGTTDDDTQSEQYSASEIRFQLNPLNASGNATYQFVANQVNQLSFEIKTNGLISSSTFNGNIQLTCFAKDSDGDGIEDALDLDSDNDGIPDFFESVAQDITLLGTDANLDGLDDVFNTVNANQDTDGDGIPNYLDLDSDNDGIYDLVESGFTLTDANNDGIIDNINSSNIGNNGLFNSLETSADSGALANPLRNSDTSSIIAANQDNLFDFVDLDADGDDCFDVTEAGFTGNGSGRLAPNPLDVNTNGLVNNSDGYTTPNANYITSAPIVVNNFPNPVFCENSTDTMSIDSNADGFQWQLSTDNGATWSNLNNDAVYNGVTTKDLQITNTPISFNNNQFRVLLSRTGNTCTDEPSNSVTLTVNPLPIIKNNTVDLLLCIDSSDNNPTVNLTTAEVNISETTGVSFEYFEDLNATTQINNFTSYPIPVNQISTVYVRVISDQGCSEGLVTLNINASQVADNTYNATQPPVCDDLLDANGNDTPGMNDDTDNITNFSLDRNAIISGINPPANTEVFFYENADDRNNSLNEIDVTNYRNDINKIDITNIPEGIRFPIYYKIVSTINNDCQGLGEFFLEIHAVPEATVVSDIEECDDALSGSTTDGRNANINLRAKVPEILGMGQTETDFAVTFHTSQDGATNNTDIITNDTNYTSEAPPGFTPGTTSEQTIFVRVEERTGNMCYNANTSFKIIVQPIPSVPTNVTDLIVCDVPSVTDSDTRNRIAQNIDLTARDAEILNGRTDLKVEYYITQQDAVNRTNVITDPTNFENSSDPSIATFPSTTEMNSTDKPVIQTIFFIVVDENGLQCPSVFSTFQLFIYPEPFVNSISVYSDCDDDSDGDDTNGIIQTIDLNGKIPEILGTNRSINDYNVTFHRSIADANSGDSPLPSPYTNSNRNETIHVRVQQKVSLCVNSSATFEIIINSLPDFSVTTPQILCLNDLPLNIFVENPGDIYRYEWQDEAGNRLGTNDNLDVVAGGKYRVIATDNVTLCQRTEIIEVNESNIATLDPNFVTIVDESNNLGSENNLSISIDTINNNLGPGDYQFAILNTDTNTRTPFIGFQDEPLFENLEGGIYQIIVNDKNGCSPDATLLVSVIQFPKFFTPNGDNENDTWVIKGANRTFYPNSSINIFNRFGKLVAQIQIDGPGWDGTYNGTQLPSDDYWYNITLVPSDNTKPTINKRGNFSLLRR